MKPHLLLLLALLLSPLSAAGSRHCKTESTRSYAEQLASLNPSVDLDLLDLDFFPGGSAVSGFEYEVEPAYTKGLYSRTDRWFIGTRMVPEEIFNPDDGLDINLSGGLENKTTATFIRFFKDPCEAMRATPYSPGRIPLRANTAVGPKFRVGDYFQFRGSVGFVATAEILSMISSSLWGAGLSGSYLMEGFYQIHIMRISENEIRLKVVAHRGKTISASLGIGFESEFNVFKVSALDNSLEKFVNTKPIKLKVDSSKSNIFMIDYVLDLTDREVASAFESILPKLESFRNIDLTGPFRKKNELEKSLLLDLTPLENLYKADFANDRQDRIRRNLRTSSDQHSLGLAIEAGNKIIGFKLEKDSSTAMMSVVQKDETIEKFLLRSWERNWDGRFFYSWFRSKKEDGFRALFTADNEFKKIKPVNMVKFMNQKKNRFSYTDFGELKLILKKSLPNEIYREIPFEKWKQSPKQKYHNYGLRFQLIMTPESIMDVPSLSFDEIRILFRDHIKSKGLSARDYFFDSRSGHRQTVARSAVEKFEINLKQMANLLTKVLDNNLPMIERLELISHLRKNKLFSESGLGFIMALKPDHIKSLYSLDLNISSNEAIIDFGFGDAETSALYRKLLTIKSALDDDSLDLLREAESLSM